MSIVFLWKKVYEKYIIQPEKMRWFNQKREDEVIEKKMERDQIKAVDPTGSSWNMMEGKQWHKKGWF